MEHSIINAVGIWFYSVNTNRYLYLLRNDAKNPGAWGLPGGKSEQGETLQDTITRECTEELGFWPPSIKLIPIEQFTSEDGKFCYHTFFSIVADEFVPSLNHEHHGYAWITSGHCPKPLHPGLWTTINFEEVSNKVKIIQNQISHSEIKVS